MSDFIKKSILTVCVCGLLNGGVSGAELGRYRIRRELTLLGEQTRQMGSFLIDDAMFEELSLEGHDLRILDSRGREIPYLMRTQKRLVIVTNTINIATRIKSAAPSKENQLEIVLDISKENAALTPCELVISTRLKNFEKHVSVYGRASENETWERLAKDCVIYDYSRFIDTRNTEVAIRAGVYRQYRIVIGNITESRKSPLTSIIRETRSGKSISEQERLEFLHEDFRVDRVSLRARKKVVKKEKPITSLCDISNVTVTEDEKNQQTIINFVSRRQPLSRLLVDTRSQNFARAAFVDINRGDPEKDPWISIAFDQISRISIPNAKFDDREIALPSSRARQYRVRIRNQDNPPLRDPGVCVWRENREVVFLSDNADKLVVVYGAEDVGAPQYDITGLLNYTTPDSVNQYTLGVVTPNPDFGYQPPSSSVSGGTILVVVVVLVALVLIFIIARMASQVEHP